jgi:3-(3-hydroxy-phenyl)propionate hydroxylase
VVFIGDSAHIVPIFGVRGLNNGIADAHNIGWKLGWVLNGRAGEELLDSYTPERRGATLDVFANATKSARFMTPPSRGWRIMRDAALGLALEHPFAGELANPRQMTPFTYAGSPAVLPDDPDFEGGVPVGAAMPDAALDDGFLSDRMSKGFTLVCFDRQLAAEVGKLPDAPDVVCLDYPGDASRALGAGPGSAYLVRPDLHIGARWVDASVEKIAAALKTLTFTKE